VRHDDSGRALRSSYSVIYRCQLRSRLFRVNEGAECGRSGSSGAFFVGQPSAVTWFRWCSCFCCGDSLRRVVSAGVRARVSVRSTGVRSRVGRLLSSGRFVRLPRIRLSRSVCRRGLPANDRVGGQGVRHPNQDRVVFTSGTTQDSG
jgi:hypothetical protein